MKKLQEEAKRFLKEEKYNLIMLADQCDDNPVLRYKVNFAPIHLLLAISTLAQGGISWRTEKLDDYDSWIFAGSVLRNEFMTDITGIKINSSAIYTIPGFLNDAKMIENNQLFHSLNVISNAEIQKKFKFYADKLKKDIVPHLDYKVAEENLSEAVVFTEYPPCMDIFLRIYRQDRDQNFFKSTGFFSRFFRGEYQEMHLRMESSEFLTFEKVLEYGVKYPKSRTASILQKYFKTYWEEANDKPLKSNLSQTDYPNVLDGLIIRDLQPIVKDYLFGS